MAHSKFVKLSLVFGSVFFVTNNQGTPTGELVEYRATRAESPRLRRMATPSREIQATTIAAQPTEESCCWSILNVFCLLMEHAGNAAPYPALPTRRMQQ